MVRPMKLFAVLFLLPVCAAPLLAASSGEDVYLKRCAVCHEQINDRTPPRAVLQKMPSARILRALDSRPPHVFVNRTPFSTGSSLITVQDNRSYLVPCTLHSRPELISGMADLGYEPVSEWPVHERKLCVPLYPDLTAHTYEGFYFRKKPS